MKSTIVGAFVRRRRPFLAALVVAAGPALGDAAPPASFVSLEWPDIVRLIEQQPQHAVGASQVEAARHGVRAAGALPNPTLEASLGRGVARYGDETRTERGLELSLPLDWIVQRGPAVGAAKAEVELAVAGKESLRRDTWLQMRTLFWNLAYEQARVASLEELEAQTGSLVEAVRRRVDSGEDRPVETTRVEIEMQRVAGDLESARTWLSSRQAELALWLTMPAGEVPVAVADLNALPATMDRAAALDAARAGHPALAAARAGTRALEYGVRAEKAARVPSMAVSGFTMEELDRRGSGIGLTIDVPIWNWNSARMAQARAELAAGRHQAELTAREIETAVIEAQAACQASVATARRFRDEVVPRSASAASVMERTYELGEVSLLEVLDVRRTLLETHRLYLSALVQAQIDCARLDALAEGERP